VTSSQPDSATNQIVVRLLILTPEFSTTGGGITTFYRTAMPLYRARGIDVTVMEGSAVHAVENNQPIEVEGVRVEFLERARLDAWHTKFSKFAALPVLRRHLAAAWAMWEQAGFGERFDVVEACDWGLLFVPVAITATRPHVVQCHGSIGQISLHDPVAEDEACSITTRLIERACMQSAQRVQTYSSANATFWRTETNREVIAIPPAWHQTNNAGAITPSGRGLVVGRVQRWKGPQVLCEALKLLRDRAPTVDWIGRDTIWGAMQSSSASHLSAAYPEVWGRTIHHHSQMSPNEVSARQHAALFNLIPSSWDVFNFTCVEAMASGRPTIVSTGAGASELIEDGENGYVFPANDAQALAALLDRVSTESQGRLIEIGKAAQQTVSTALDPANIAERRFAAYTNVIDDFAHHQPAAADGWLAEICHPSQSSSNEMAFLEHFPLRNLARHVVDRTTRKVLQ